MSRTNSPGAAEDERDYVHMSEAESIESDSYDSDSQRPTEEQKMFRAEFIAKMWEVYNAGTKLYTKEMIKHAQKELSTFPLNWCIHMPGFDGEIHQLRLLLSIIRFESFERFVYPSPLTYQHEPDNTNMCAVLTSSVSSKSFNPSSDMPLETIAKSFDRQFEAWSQSDTWKSLADIFSSTKLPPVDKIIAFGLGTISPRKNNRPVRRSMVQHGMLISLARLIEGQYGGRVACYAQDPAYFNTCKDVLSSRGITVLEPEAGFVMLDEKTLVVSIHPNIPVRQVTADLGRPAVMIWDRIDEDRKVGKWKRMKNGCLLSPFGTDPISPRVKALRLEYAEYSFPKDPEHFGDLCVYIRKDMAES